MFRGVFLKAKLVVLGVNHAFQLVSEECQPAAYRAFMNRVNPDGIGVERAPEYFDRGDYYEFTYEQQNLCVPYAIEKGIELHPFDWMLSSEDQLLAWGTPDIDEPPLIREKHHYKDFTHFPQLEEDFFYSERPEVIEKIKNWTENAITNQGDFPRRLFLYRTYMQAMRIKEIAELYKGKTLLIVVGHMHKSDIENMLSSEEDIEIIQPSVYGYPESHEIRENQKTEDFLAIASFNLVGAQRYHETDREWVERVIEHLHKLHPSVETEVYTLLFHQNVYSKDELIHQYHNLHQQASDESRFTYTGIVDESRLDSYFNPFACLSIKSYLKLLMAKEYIQLGNALKASELKTKLLEVEALNPQQKQQFEGYWERFIQ